LKSGGYTSTINAPSKMRNCAKAQYHQTICAVKSHSRLLAKIPNLNLRTH